MTSNKSSLFYTIRYEDGDEEVWSLAEVNEALKGDTSITPITCIEAISESFGYGNGRDIGLGEALPANLNPSISDEAAQVALRSRVFRSSILVIYSLDATPFSSDLELTAEEWLSIISLLVVKCTNSDKVMEVASILETSATEELSKKANLAPAQPVEGALIDDAVGYLVSEDEYESDHDENASDEISTSSMLEKGCSEVSNISKKAKSAGKSRTKKSKKKDEKDGSDALFIDSDDDDEMDGEGDTDADEEEWNDRGVPTIKGNEETVDVESVEEAEVVDTMDVEEDAAAIPNIVVSEVQSTIDARNFINEKQDEDDPAQTYFQEMVARRDATLKAREDCLLSHILLKQMNTVVSSFEMDTWTPSVYNVLFPRRSATISYDSICKPSSVCAHCGMSDIALGSPLVRAPNNAEWMELIGHSLANRPTHLIAQIDGHANMATGEGTEMTENSEIKQKFISVRVRLNNNPNTLVSGHSYITGNKAVLLNGGLQDYILANPNGAQSDFFFRDESKLPYSSGSLVAHRSCADVSHSIRMERLRDKFQGMYQATLERDYGRRCGRTLPIGKDSRGWLYWIFVGEHDALFISHCSIPDTIHRYKEPDVIASIIINLCSDDSLTHTSSKKSNLDLVKELKRFFPSAAKLLRRRKWATLIQKRAWTRRSVDGDAIMEDVEDELLQETSEKNAKVSSNIDGDRTKNADRCNQITSGHLETRDPPFEEGEQVLVDGANGSLLWNAVIVNVSIDEESGKVDGYRVHYSDWSSRFDEWVAPLRVVEPSEYNVEVMQELYEEVVSTRNKYENGDISSLSRILPTSLRSMNAVSHLNSPRRARGMQPPTSLDDVFEKHVMERNTSRDLCWSRDQTLASLKASLLLIETAFPIKLVDTSPKGHWRSIRAEGWRMKVKKARGPSALMECVIMLEDVLTRAQKTPAMTLSGQHLLFCQPKFWKAIADATLSSVAMRTFLLDNAIKFYAPREKSQKRKQ